MSLVVSNKTPEAVKLSYLSFLEDLTNLIKKKNPKFDPSPTKLGDIKRNLNNFDNLSFKDQLYTLDLANKFSNIEPLLDIAEVCADELQKLGKGGFQPDNDSEQEYNSIFYELAMATRYVKSPETSSLSINLVGITDLVIDSSIAIECKYPRSNKQLMKNIKIAKKQIDKRVKDGIAKHGIIALDLSHLLNYELYGKFFNNVLKKIHSHYRQLEYVTSDSYIYNTIIKNKEFIDIVTEFGRFLLETIISPHKKNISLSENVLGIHYEYSNTFIINSDEIMIVRARELSYFTNPKLCDEEKRKFEELSHALVVGI
ncbi:MULTISPECIES: hypothetical protein [unclassified Pseudoalteromonas]|uniref:hypothetical protein n=3 Tax=Pseudoalteromonas TaxID=53246 RepID=UPI001F2F01F6|nr:MULTISPECIES: hypothetical protein [unclassified Pseudoalteromonas]MCF2827121.1 hypothetical protein [Pseudoalteromonas sp. OF5H-5]MCF2925866.1 hypothetical protein [Pseudoalteromonas sp. DL2-H1]